VSDAGGNAGGEAAPVFGLVGARALVLGGGGGIGAAIVARLRAVGARVISADRVHAGGMDELLCDLRLPGAAADAVTESVARLGGLDLVVHSAGITRDGVLWKLGDDDWRDVLALNLDSGFHCCARRRRTCAPRAAAAVVLIASINGERGKFGQSNYCASKAGLIALARTAARELGAHGVRVNAVAPGLIETPMTAGLPAEVRRRAIEETALGRAGTPEDVADATLFLLSDLARHVTGQVLRVDGGQLTA
jgi:3-oxoacyl-[acyl-carrier protein] reductase